MATILFPYAHAQNTFPSSGNVGIGTNSPQYPLDVHGSARITDTVFTSDVVITNQMQADTVRSVRTAVTGTATVLGYLGLGTINPNVRLDVNGNANVSGMMRVYRINGLAGDSILRLGDSSLYILTGQNRIAWNSVTYNNITRFGMSIGNTSNNEMLGLHSIGLGQNIGTGSSALFSIVMGSGVAGGRLTNPNANSMMVGFNSDVPTFTINSSNGAGTTGNVSIGHGIGKVNFGDAQSTALNFGAGYMGFNAIRDFNGNWTIGTDNANNGAAVVYTNVQGSIYFANVKSNGSSVQTLSDANIFNSVKMTIGANGNVGIGTAPSSTYKLVVEGTLGAREVKVTLNSWPDYVFDKEHQMLPLEKYGDYLDKNHHLYNFPSANDLMSAGGLELGKMQVMQTEKLEELYLYVIELNRKNEMLSGEVELLKQEIELLKKK